MMKVTKKVAITLNALSDSWGWELYCEKHAPKEDAEITNILDDERINNLDLGCLCCGNGKSSLLMSDDN